MPLYEYQCEDCGHRFERIQRFSDPLASTCPVCGGAVRKLLSSPAIQFKGTGWYITDYARKADGKEKTPAAQETDKKKAETKEKAKGDAGQKTKPADQPGAGSTTKPA